MSEKIIPLLLELVRLGIVNSVTVNQTTIIVRIKK